MTYAASYAEKRTLLNQCSSKHKFENAQGAEEFRGAKRQRPEGDQKAGQADGTKKRRGVAFGTGAAEETDTYGYMEDYVSHDGQPRGADFNFEIASDEEDTDLPLARSTTQATMPNYFVHANCDACDVVHDKQGCRHRCRVAFCINKGTK